MAEVHRYSSYVAVSVLGSCGSKPPLPPAALAPRPLCGGGWRRGVAAWDPQKHYSHIYMYVCHIYIYMFEYTYLCEHLGMHIHIYIYIYIYVYIVLFWVSRVGDYQRLLQVTA